MYTEYEAQIIVVAKVTKRFTKVCNSSEQKATAPFFRQAGPSFGLSLLPAKN